MPPKNTDTVPAEVRRMEGAVEDFAPATATLRGDIRDAMLGQLRHATDFSKVDEARQRDINAAIDFAATEFTMRAVRLLASEGKTQVQAKLEQITVKDGLKINCTGVHTHDSLQLLGDAVGKQVLITVADAEQFDGQRAEAQVDADQPELLGSDGNSDLADAGDNTAHGVEIMDEQPFDAGDEELAGN